MDRFSNEAISKMGYYVYRLVDPRNGQTFYVGFSFAITNHLGDAFFRGMAVCRISDINRTNPTSWVHFSSLPHKIYEKLQSPRREAFLRA